MVAVPGVALAVAGLFHPALLTPATAAAWWQLHVVALPLFPLLGAALWVLLRGERGPLAWFARVAAYVYAAFYTGLDTLAGIGAGLAVAAQPDVGPVVGNLFRIGDDLAAVGVWAFLAAAVATGAVLVRRDGVRALPGAVILAGAAVPFLTSHIFWPVGGLTMLAIALGCALLATEPRGHDARHGLRRGA